jgi:protein kinase A
MQWNKRVLNPNHRKQKEFQVLNSILDTRAIPDFGPVDIQHYHEFLQKSREQFFHTWSVLSNKKLAKELEVYNCTLKDFKKWNLLGEGFFGRVYLVSNDQTGEFQAMKALLKEKLVNLQHVEQIRTEKLVLQCANHPFITHLDYFFIDNSYLYFIMPFIQGGVLGHHLKKFGKFDEMTSMFYLSQLILALEYLHNLDIIYRDIKPDNILIDHTGYLKVVDFGLSKRLTEGRTYTVCGTPEYLAPEVIAQLGYGKSADWWAVGVMAFNLTTGYTPFQDYDVEKTISKIVKGTYETPSFMSNDLQNLLTHILQVDVTKRYGTMKNGVDDIKNHKWFRPVHWKAIMCRKSKPPFIPTVEGPSDTRHFTYYEYKSLIIANKPQFPEQFIDF